MGLTLEAADQLSAYIPFDIATAETIPDMQLATGNFYRSGTVLSGEDLAQTRQAVIDFYINKIDTTEYFSTVEHILSSLDKSLSHIGCNSVAETNGEDRSLIRDHLLNRSLKVIEASDSGAVTHMTLQNFLRSMRHIGSPVRNDDKLRLLETSRQSNQNLSLTFGNAAEGEEWTRANEFILKPVPQEAPHLTIV